jgi:hypothetical protein
MTLKGWHKEPGGDRTEVRYWLSGLIGPFEREDIAIVNAHRLAALLPDTVVTVYAHQMSAHHEDGVLKFDAVPHRVVGSYRRGECCTSRITHTKDTDCTIDPDTMCCIVCGVSHGSPCEACRGSGFHADGCPEWAE